jgi:NAD(P)-dependent dehydrogenase (short-subunit alcohol dehydrogenase family)
VRLFDLTGKVALVTGGTGVLGSTIARGLAQAGAKVGILGRREEVAQEVANTIRAEGGEALAVPADVLEREELVSAKEAILRAWGRLDVLVNVAGGNMPEATAFGDRTFSTFPRRRLPRFWSSTSPAPSCPRRSSARR